MLPSPHGWSRPLKRPRAEARREFEFDTGGLPDIAHKLPIDVPPFADVEADTGRERLTRLNGRGVGYEGDRDGTDLGRFLLSVFALVDRLVCGAWEALNGSPVLDIKPYMSSVPVTELRRGWLEEAEKRAR